MQNVVCEPRVSIIENIAHDLKSPIYSQINALNLLLDDKSYNMSETQRELLSDLLASNMYMKDIILNILTAFRAKCSNFILDIAPHDFLKTLDDAIKSIKYIFRDNNNTLSVVSKSDYICSEYDEIQIKRVLVNLITNATKHSYANSQIEVICKQSMGSLYVSVINDGHIDFDNVDDIFKPYNTKSKAKGICGSGLGLYISKLIISQHGGEISAKNIDDKVCMEFNIPIINKRI